MPPFDCITKRTLQTLAGERWFNRGKVYMKQGRVADLIMRGESLSANVAGAETYRVRLSCRNNRLTYSCTCPLGADGNFCKHCVAVGLAWLEEPAATSVKADSLQGFLERMDRKELVELIVNEASHNKRFREQLELQKALAIPTAPDVTVFKKAITDATRTTGIDYYAMPRFARRLEETIASLWPLLEAGHSKAVVELTEYAFARLEKAIGRVDDSDGHFGEIIPELTHLHHQACVLGKEDPIALARRLFKFEIATEWDFFSQGSAVYADVLGKEGLLEYRRLAEEIWSTLPELKPGDDSHLKFGDRYRITTIMETLAS